MDVDWIPHFVLTSLVSIGIQCAAIGPWEGHLHVRLTPLNVQFAFELSNVLVKVSKIKKKRNIL